MPAQTGADVGGHRGPPLHGAIREFPYLMPDNLNLVPERGPNVWDRPSQPAGRSVQTGTAVGGAVMLAAGAAAAFFGGRMLYRAVRNARERGDEIESDLRSSSLRGMNDIVDEESAESFPASDAPSWSSQGATLDRRRQGTEDRGRGANASNPRDTRQNE